MKITLDTGRLTQAGKSIEDAISGRQLSGALNQAATAARLVFTRQWSDEVNLPLAYIESLYTVNRAAPQRLVAEVRGRRRDVQLRQYAAQREFGRDGKPAGVSVQVKPGGGRKTIGQAFYLKLRRGSVAGGNGEGVFVRTGGRLKLLYGPAPYQAFTRLAPEAIERGEDALNRTVLAGLDRVLFEVTR